MPSAARPAAKVTACCSAMPTSKVRSGKRLPNMSRLVPDGIAAVMATILSSFSACLISSSANTVWYFGALDALFTCSPVMTSNFCTLCSLSAAFLADS